MAALGQRRKGSAVFLSTQVASTPPATGHKICAMTTPHATAPLLGEENINDGACMLCLRCSLAASTIVCRQSGMINVIARCEARSSCTIKGVTVRTPMDGYNSPVAQLIVFASLGQPFAQ